VEAKSQAVNGEGERLSRATNLQVARLASAAFTGSALAVGSAIGFARTPARAMRGRSMIFIVEGWWFEVIEGEEMF